VVVLTGSAGAQGRAEGWIVGVVADSTGGVLPGDTVTATNHETALSRTSVTDADGSYRLAALPPGTYDVSAELSGFSTVKQTIRVTVGSEAKLDLSLGLGSLRETVVVTSEAPLVEPTKTEQSVTLTETEVRNLPTNSRDFQEFALLAPGVVRARTSGAGWGGESGFSTSGNRGDQNSINIDGLTNRQYDDGIEAGNFSQEAVQEFQVITQSYPAEFGGSAGGVINAVTRSGTNQLKGYGFLYLRDDALDKPPFALETDPSSGVVTAKSTEDRADFRRIVSGFSVGGPILRDRLFFHTVFDRLQSSEPRVRSINPSTLAAVRQIAYPNLPDDDTNRVSTYKPRTTKFSLKIDDNMSGKHTAAYRISTARDFRPSGSAQGRNSLTTSSETRIRFNMASASLNSFLSDRVLNSFRFQWNESKTSTDWPFLGGLDNVLTFPPRIAIGGGSGGSFGRSNGGGQPYNDETKWELQNTVTWSTGRHDIKFGGQFMIVQFWLDFSRPDGDWAFSDINAFLAGRPSAYEQGWGPSAGYLASKYATGFVQDEWTPLNGLTLNAGVRYDLALHPTDVSSWEVKKGTVNPNTGEPYTTGSQPAMLPGYINDTNNVMPRLGASYTPDQGRTLFRAASGLFYGNQYVGELTNALIFGGPPMGTRYRFTPAEAAAVWAGTLDPSSPYYNPLGVRRLPNSIEQQLIAMGKRSTVLRFQRDLETPYSVQANVGVDRQLMQGVAVTASFLWSRGYNNVRSVNVNHQAPTFYEAGSLMPTGIIAPYDMYLFLGPRPDPGIEENLLYVNNGRVSYKGASAGITFRRGGLLARASYTLTDAWDDSAAITIRQGPADLTVGTAGEWSRSLLSTRHRLIVSSVYELPKRWPLLARNWQIAGVVNVESGHPYQVTSGTDFNNDTVLTDRPTGVPRNSLWTDRIYNVDLRISRWIPLSGRVRLEALFEAFNLFNTPHYDQYVDSLYVFDRAQGRYVPRADFAAFANSPNLSARDYERSPEEIGLDPKIRRNGVGAPFQGQVALRLHF
jgi:hypothetical protein